MGAAIEIVEVSKRFRIGDQKIRSIKERAVSFRRQQFHEFWALRDVSFEVDEGETVGLLGHNGSGKSTLLKMVGGIMQPTSGSIRVRGRMASLLELGAGFHPDLTGRENVFLNASILGLSKADVTARFDEIVEFAELEEFIDLQVKHYSSGMYVRLGFAVAVNVDPDVLLVDEVLAVGDETFQRKCLERIARFQHEGRTIVVVSHAPDLMRQICDRIAVMDHGHLVTYGAPGESIRTFRDTLLANALERQAWLDARHGEDEPTDDAEPIPFGSDAVDPFPTSTVRFRQIELDHPNSSERAHLLPGEPLTIRIGYVAKAPTDDVVFGLSVFDDRDGKHLFGVNTELLGVEVPTLEGEGEVVFNLEGVPLLDGSYALTFEIHSLDQGTRYDWIDQQHRFTVMNPDRRTGVVAVPISAKLST